MSETVTVYHNACGGALQVQAEDLVYQGTLIFYTCPRCDDDVQVNG